MRNIAARPVRNRTTTAAPKRGAAMALIDMKERANESDAYRFRMLDNGMPTIVAVSRAAAQIAGGFHSNRAQFALIAQAKHSKGAIEANGTIFIDASDL